MDFIVEAMTTDGRLCERFRSYARARRCVDAIPAEKLVGLPMIFRILPDGSQRLVRDDGKPLQWHRFGEDGTVVTDETIPLSPEEPDDGWTGPRIRPVERPPQPWGDEEDGQSG